MIKPYLSLNQPSGSKDFVLGVAQKTHLGSVDLGEDLECLDEIIE